MSSPTAASWSRLRLLASPPPTRAPARRVRSLSPCVHLILAAAIAHMDTRHVAPSASCRLALLPARQTRRQRATRCPCRHVHASSPSAAPYYTRPSALHPRLPRRRPVRQPVPYARVNVLMPLCPAGTSPRVASSTGYQDSSSRRRPRSRHAHLHPPSCRPSMLCHARVPMPLGTRRESRCLVDVRALVVRGEPARA